MIEEYGNVKEITEQAVGTSRVNLTQGIVESVKYDGWGDYTEELRTQVDYRKRIETLFPRFICRMKIMRIFCPKR